MLGVVVLCCWIGAVGFCCCGVVLLDRSCWVYVVVVLCCWIGAVGFMLLWYCIVGLELLGLCC